VLIAGPLVSWIVASLEGAVVVGGVSALGAGLVSIDIPKDSVIKKAISSNLNLAADGFNIWWNKTVAQHTAVVAQASALVRAYRHVSSDGETRIGQAL